MEEDFGEAFLGSFLSNRWLSFSQHSMINRCYFSLTLHKANKQNALGILPTLFSLLMLLTSPLLL